MKITRTPHRRAFAALVPATLLLAAPAFAQEAAPAPPPPVQTTTTPPPVARTLPDTGPDTGPEARPEAGAPSVATPMTNGVAARNGIGDPNSSTPISPEAMTQAEEGRAARQRTAAPVRAAPRVAPLSAPAAGARPAAPATAPAQNAAPVPVAVAPPAAPVAQPAPVAASQPAQPETATTATTETTTDAAPATGQPAPIWPWLLAGLVVLGGLLAFFLRRRNRTDEYEEVYEEPVVHQAAEPAVLAPVVIPVTEPVIATQTQGHSRLEPQFLRNDPVAAAPLAAAPLVAASVADMADAQAVEAELAEPEAAEVAALTAGTAHGDRPWLEFAMRPVRAGSNADDALVEIELTVGNSGAVAAQDVRISTFMFADGSASRGEMERLLTERSADSEVSPVTIEPGEGTRVDATLSLPRDQFGEEARTFNPVILADARYRMADGTEGRTSASFTIGMIGDGDGDMRGIAIHRPQMSDDIEARLHGEPAHS